MPKGDFGGKRNSNGFDKRPGDINKKGPPKKGVSLIIDQLNEKGYEVVTKGQIEEAYMNILNLKDAEITELLENTETPVLVKVICQNIIGGNNFNVVERMLDRTLGKAEETHKSEMTIIDMIRKKQRPEEPE